jgi:hypothetical protein
VRAASIALLSRPARPQFWARHTICSRSRVWNHKMLCLSLDVSVWMDIITVICLALPWSGVRLQLFGKLVDEDHCLWFRGARCCRCGVAADQNLLPAGEKKRWLTATPDFASGVNQRDRASRENTWFFAAQVNTCSKSLSTTRKVQPRLELGSRLGQNRAESLLTCGLRGIREWALGASAVQAPRRNGKRRRKLGRPALISERANRRLALIRDRR